MASDVRTATAFLQIEGKPVGNKYDFGNEAIVRSVHNQKPRTVHRGCVVVKVKIRIPKEAWEPFAPEAVIEVPADLIQHVIEVEAGDANG